MIAPGEAGSADSAGGGPGPSATLSRMAALHEQLDDFALIVLAVARRARDGFQDFVVVRVFRGSSPHTLRLKSAGRLADQGRLQLVLARPLALPKAAPSTETTTPGAWSGGEETTSTPDAGVGAAAAQLFGASVPVVYTYNGGMAVARELPDGTDPAAVTLP